MNRILRPLLAVLLILALAPIGAPQESRPVDRETVEKARARWNDLPAARREELKRKLQEFKSLPPEARARIRANVERFQHMSPEERQAFRKKLAVMTPEERRQFFQSTSGIAQMPPKKRDLIMCLGRMMGGLSPEQRDKVKQLAGPDRERFVRRVMEQKFSEKFLANEEERAAFEAAPPDQRLRKMRQVLQQKFKGPPFGPRKGEKGEEK